MLQLHLSNRLECLAGQMLDRLEELAPPVFDARQIIVASAGMRRFVELAVARRFGICANFAFGFPARWIWLQIAAITGASPDRSPFDAELLAWRLLAWFETQEAMRHPRLRTYLRAGDAAMRWELALRTARLFERYVAYRQDWLAAWAAGNRAPLHGADAAHLDDEAWQMQAWRAILAAGAIGPQHPAEAMFRAIEASGTGAAQRQRLPEGVDVFGVPELPPLYLDILHRLSRWMRIDVYLLDPCRQYWFEIRSEKQLARLAAAGRAAGVETGNALLAGWGEQSKALLEHAIDLADADFDDAFVEPAPDSVLHRVQRAILDLEPLAAGTLAADPPDASLCIHVCHSPTREIEVLHDQLLARFEADPSLTPGDVLVVTPDLERAAPLIDAVFGAALGERHIPYAITGRSPCSAGSLTQVFLELLDVARTRCEASRLYDLLRVGALARAFGLDDEGLDAIHRWMRGAGMRWGLDDEHRRSLGAPEASRRTLDASLRSLLLGYTLPAGSAGAMTGAWPYPDVEGRLAFPLGGFWRFSDELRKLRDQLPALRDAQRWRNVLTAALDTFFAPDAGELDELRALHAAIDELAQFAARGAGERHAWPFEVFRMALAEHVAAHAPGGVPTGQVTFTGMSQLRGLPYRLICCIGLDHAAFPASEPELEFDLMARWPRRGDRVRRNEQRNVFLDLLLAAREAFYLSYTGRSVRDDRERPPSVVVSDLLDHLVCATTPEGASEHERARARGRFVTRHPLQAFSARYFTGEDPRLFSYDAAMCPAIGADARSEAFFRAPLAASVPDEPVALEDLAQFLKHPARFLLGRRLGLRLEAARASLQDEDAFDMDFDAAARVRSHVLDLIARGWTNDEVIKHALRHPDLPEGELGRIDLAEILERAVRFVARDARARRHPSLAPREARINTEAGTITAMLDGLSTAGMLLARFGPSGMRSRIECWVRHLALCADRPQGVALRTQFLGEDECFHFAPVEDAGQRLAALLRLFREGWCRPVHFFPRTGLAFVETNDLEAARATWLGSWRARNGESRDPWYRLAFGEDAGGAIDERFAACAREILGPLRGAFADGIHDEFA